jgi:predicted GIY-YIG superfamily endonuclease
MSRVPGIYQIKCIVTDKIYIGGSNNIIRRKYEHYWGLRSGNHPNIRLQAAFNEYKEESCEF